jgi:hypothetical protein
MAEKKWSDYWSNYRDSKGKKVDTQRKPDVLDVGQARSAPERPRPTVRVRRHRSTSPRIGEPSIDKQVVFLFMFLAAIVLLSFLQFRSTHQIRTLQFNVTNLTDSLDSCAASNTELSGNLRTCSSNLEGCQTDLSSKTSLLSTCNSDKATATKDLGGCKEDLDRVKSDKMDLQVEYNSLQESRDKCKDDLDSAESDYASLLSNLRGYAAKGKCCGTSNSVSYSVESNNIVCYSDASGAYSLTC